MNGPKNDPSLDEYPPAPKDFSPQVLLDQFGILGELPVPVPMLVEMLKCMGPGNRCRFMEQLMLRKPVGWGSAFDLSGKSDEEIVAQALELARTFYKAHGFEVAEGFKFYESNHPQEQGMWTLAAIAFEELTGTDINDALANIGE